MNGGSFMGKMMVVHDPGRVRVAALASFDAEGQGQEAGRPWWRGRARWPESPAAALPTRAAL